MSNPGEEVQQELQMMRVGYVNRLPAKISEMETLTKQVEAVRVEERPAVLKKALLIAHSITGTSATYGFNEISAAAHAMELYLRNFNGTVLEDNNQVEAAGLLDKLQQEVETARQTAPTTQWHY